MASCGLVAAPTASLARCLRRLRAGPQVPRTVHEGVPRGGGESRAKKRQGVQSISPGYRVTESSLRSWIRQEEVHRIEGPGMR